MPQKGNSKESKTTRRRHSERLEEKEKQKRLIKPTTTNLKDLFKRSNSSLKSNSAIEKDGDFVFKRTSSQLEEPISLSQSKKQKSSIPLKKSKIRKLTAEDVLITPEVKRINNRNRNSNKNDNDNNYNYDDDSYVEHSTSTQIPISGSPIIRRNKDSKKNNNNNNNKNRRSTLVNRGKRVSSIGNGFNGVPHDMINTSEYYKHLDNDLPDPHKMRQLLIWCSKKKVDEDKNKHIKQKNKLSNEELTALNIAKVIKEEIVRDLVDGKINISWWAKDDDNELNNNENKSSQEIKIVPNERNINNEKVLNDLQKRLKDLKSKSEEWEKSLSENVELKTPKIPKDLLKNQLNTSLNNEEFNEVINSSIIDEINKLQDLTYNDISESLELDVDTFNDNVHKLKSASSIRSKFISLKSKKLTEILDSTFTDDTIHKIQNSPVNREIDTNQLLRGITRLDTKN